MLSFTNGLFQIHQREKSKPYEVVPKLPKRKYIFTDTSSNDVSEDLSKISQTDLISISHILENLSSFEFFYNISKIDRTNSIIVDIVDGQLQYSPIIDLSLVSSSLLNIVKKNSPLNMTFDKQLLIRLYCQQHGIPYKEYAIMVDVKNKDTKLVKSISLVEYIEDSYYVDGYLFKSINDIVEYTLSKSMISIVTSGYKLKEITDYPIENTLTGDFINNVFI